MAGTAVQGGGQAVQVDGGYRVTGRWSFGSGCQESHWMLASFQILDDGKPRVGPEGRPLYWRGIFKRDEAEIVPGSWDVSGLRGTGSFDWTVHDVFLPERRTMVHAGVPLDNQWERWPGVTYKLPAHVLGRAASQRGHHRHRARRHQRADRSGRRQDAARPHRPVMRQSAGAGRGRPRRRDPQCRPQLPQRDDRRRSGRASPPARARRWNSAPAAASPRSTPPIARGRRWI